MCLLLTVLTWLRFLLYCRARHGRWESVCVWGGGGGGGGGLEGEEERPEEAGVEF